MGLWLLVWTKNKQAGGGGGGQEGTSWFYVHIECTSAFKGFCLSHARLRCAIILIIPL